MTSVFTDDALILILITVLLNLLIFVKRKIFLLRRGYLLLDLASHLDHFWLLLLMFGLFIPDFQVLGPYHH